MPKGVAIEHRNAVAFLYWAKRVFSAEQLAGVLASTRRFVLIFRCSKYSPRSVGAGKLSWHQMFWRSKIRRRSAKSP